MSEKGPQSVTKKQEKAGGRRGCRRGGVAMVAVKGMGYMTKMGLPRA